MTFAPSWTTEQEDRLRALVAEGKSFSGMAAELGVTKNACIGKAHRLRLPPKPPPAPLPKSARLNRPPQPKPKPAKRPQPRRSGTAVTFAELTSETCRWPLFEGSEPFHQKRFCGEAIIGGPYCAAHARICYSKGGGST